MFSESKYLQNTPIQIKKILITVFWHLSQGRPVQASKIGVRKLWLVFFKFDPGPPLFAGYFEDVIKKYVDYFIKFQ